MHTHTHLQDPLVEGGGGLLDAVGVSPVLHLPRHFNHSEINPKLMNANFSAYLFLGRYTI